MEMQKIKSFEDMELRYTYKALVELEKNNINVFDIDNHRNFKDLMLIAKCGLLHENKFTDEEMYEIMDGFLSNYNIVELFEILVVAISFSLSGGKHNENNNEELEDDSEKKQ